MTSVKKNFFLNSSYQILNMLVPIVVTPYITRTLGATGIGVYCFNYSIAYYFVMFIMLGLNNYGNREIAKSRISKEIVSRVFWSIYISQFLLGVCLNILFILYSIFLSNDMAASIFFIFYTLSGIFDINWFFMDWKNLNL